MSAFYHKPSVGKCHGGCPSFIAGSKLQRMSHIATWNGETQSRTHTRQSGWESHRDLRVPGLTVLYHPDLHRIGERVALPQLQRASTAGGARGTEDREVRLSRLEPLFAPPGSGEVRPLADPRISRSPLLLRATPAGIELNTRSSRTEVHVDDEVVRETRVFDTAALLDGVVLLLAGRVVLLLHTVDPVSSQLLPRHGLIGESPAMRQVRQDIQRLADLVVPVLLRGETGTGKEVVASALHAASPRRDRPFVALNMASLPPALAAAELFGAGKGAFTGADRARDGYFRKARQGTLFLDEVGETPEEVQAMLLRTLETGEVQPLGAAEAFQADVRLLAATDADLEAAVAGQRFRAPLLHRLQGYEIRIPPLRARREDFGRLLRHFLRLELEVLHETHKLETTPGGSPWLPAELVARLAVCHWPGNVRQLRNVVRQLVIAGRGESRLRPSSQLENLLAEIDVPACGRTAERRSRAEHGSGVSPLRPSRPTPATASAPTRRPSDLRQEEVLAALREQRWRIQDAARQLGIPRPSLYDLIHQIPGIRKAADLDRDEIEQSLARCRGNLDAMVDELEVSKQGLRRRMKHFGLSLDLGQAPADTPRTRK